MINITDDMTAAVRAAEDEAIKSAAEAVSAALEKSRNTPYRQIAALLAVLYVLLLFVAGVVARVFFRSKPDDLDCALADTYVSVPEMALHKAIEIRSLEQVELHGVGLDLGCGDGLVGGILARRAGLDQLYGTDLSDIAPETLQAQGYVEYRKGDIQGLPFNDATFDYAISICVMEHIPDIDKAIRDVHRVLKPGGCFAFTTPNSRYGDALFIVHLLRGIGLRQAADDYKRRRDFTAMHYTYRQADEWVQILSSLGFHDITVTPIFSSRQHLVYDLMNIQAHILRFYFYPHLVRWTAKCGYLKRTIARATAYLSAAVQATLANDSTATHWRIVCYSGE
jgi:SAM-dependent methyltransferase